MKFNKKDLILYAVTDRTWLKNNTLYEQVEEALKGGATFVQLREKELDDETFLKEAFEIKKLCRQYNVPFVINDNVDVAIKANADGVHIGQYDMEAGYVRSIIGKDKILGISAQTVEQAIFAEKMGADYLGVGAVFNTDSKADADDVSHKTLKAICDAVSIPVVAIGGIGISNILELTGSGIHGVAVISAIFSAENIKKTTAELKKLTKQVVCND
ncbi:MAG: thiamine phosphate synthase [Clostridia bacterium]|nr:thiamine phosphate synthase [Clostridia bacterium]